MSAYTIASYGTLTVTQPVSLGSTVTFMNNEGTDGVVIFTRSAFDVTTTSTNGTYTANAGWGGTVTNFLPGAYGGAGGLNDFVTIQAFTSLFNAMDVASTASTDNAAFDAQMSFAAHSYARLFLVNGTIVPGVQSGFTLNANEAQIIDEIAVDLFGTAANTSTLDIAFAYRTNPNSNQQFIDAIITTTTPVNETESNPCFAAGTRILTTRGEIPVEELAEGDLVIMPDGEEQPIIWIGVRHVTNIKSFHRPEAVRPIIITEGALADNMPARDLALSPDHALYFDGVFVPAKELVNWNSIYQDQRVDSITYYHLELPRHGVVFAESTPTESYLDTGGRGAFDNDASPIVDHPTLMQQRRDTQAYAPFCYAGPQLDTIRARIAARQVGVRLASAI